MDTDVKWTFGIFTTIWVAVSGWIHTRGSTAIDIANEAKAKSDSTKAEIQSDIKDVLLYIANNHDKKKEVDKKIDDAVIPIHERLNEIRDDVKYLRDKKEHGD